MTQTYQPFQPLLTAAGSKAFGLRVQQRSPCSALRGIVDSYIQVGSDSPTLPLDLVDRAFATLKNNDVVLGPTTDGGYYLVGAARRVPDIFDGILWSTSRVWQQTVERLCAADIAFGVLDSWYDVDDRATLERLCEELCGPDTAEPALLDLRGVVGATDSG